MLLIAHSIHRLRVFIALGLLPALWVSCQSPSSSSSQKESEIVLIENFPSENVTPRNVSIYLPPGYDEEQQYPVIYAHDGQNLFEPGRSWTGEEWQMDETLDSLISSGKLSACMVVGIWNTGNRRGDYMPARPDSLVRAALKAGYDSDKFEGQELHSDEYLLFIVNELKPYIEKNYAVRPGRAHTYVMGSSMGGLISLYAISEYPEVFGKAACISTHWPALGGTAIEYMKMKLPDPGVHKLYFDHGTEGLDSAYAFYQEKADSILLANGFEEGPDFISMRFEGADHNEAYWRKRLAIPLKFLLEKK